MAKVNTSEPAYPMIIHLISRIMLSISSTPGASLAKIKALRVKDQNDLEMIFRCIVEKMKVLSKSYRIGVLSNIESIFW